MNETDLESCAREPIHIPGAIQPQGVLLVLDGDAGSIVASSSNASVWLGGDPKTLLAASTLAAELQTWGQGEDAFLQWAGTVGTREVTAVAHRSGDQVVLEFEARPDNGATMLDRCFASLRGFTEALGPRLPLDVVLAEAARFVRDVTGFDRVLVYKFDEDWNGHVLAEDGNGALPSYIDLRFPAGDIPAQARRLYTLNRVRIIPDAAYEPVPIEGLSSDAAPLDLSFSTLRSVSPVHVEYMRNMGTQSSMSISIIVDDRLWGLVACHGREANMVTLQARNACDLGVQILAAEIASRERSADSAARLSLGDTHSRLLARMAAESDWRIGLAGSEDDVLQLAGADGFAMLAEDADLLTAGTVPSRDELLQIVEWLERRETGDRFVTESLSEVMDGAEGMAETAAGVLAIRISELHPSWLIWFRGEVVRTVTWGGDPHKVVREEGRIHPRHSFAAWKEQVRLRALPWSSAHIDAAENLRRSVLGIVLRRAEEMAALTDDLRRSNKELEAFSYSISHDLRAPFRHIVGYAELLREREKSLDAKSAHYLESISDSARAAGQLVDDLLNFSQIGRAALAPRPVDMGKLVAEVRHSLAVNIRERDIDWRIGELPAAWGDPTLLRQVLFNLVENAIKYTGPRATAVIEIAGLKRGAETEYSVSDNGVGFDMAYKDKLFGVFQRLQRAEDFEGTGIGLALARRIVERHGGRIWAHGELDQGASFRFALPTRPTED